MVVLRVKLLWVEGRSYCVCVCVYSVCIVYIVCVYSVCVQCVYSVCVQCVCTVYVYSVCVQCVCTVCVYSVCYFNVCVYSVCVQCVCTVYVLYSGGEERAERRAHPVRCVSSSERSMST